MNRRLALLGVAAGLLLFSTVFFDPRVIGIGVQVVLATIALYVAWDQLLQPVVTKFIMEQKEPTYVDEATADGDTTSES